MKVIYNITKNKFNASLNQETTEIKVSFKTGYYPLSGGGGGDLSNYYTKQEVIDNFKPTSYNPNIDEVLINGNITSENIIFNSSDGWIYWQNNITSYGIYLQKTNIASNEVEEIVFGHEGITSSNSSGSTAIIFAPKTKNANVTIPNESGTIVLDYQLNDFYKKTETYSKTEVDDIISDIPFVDTSNLVPYTGANKDVNIASNYFKTSKGFDFTKDDDNYFRTFNNGSFNNFVFRSKDNGDDNFGSIYVTANPEEGFTFQYYNDTGSNLFQVSTDSTYSKKPFVSNVGFKTPTGTPNQALTANGGVFDLNTKADLVGGKVPSSQLPSYVDDVLEFEKLASFPATGESGKIYIAIDTNITYRWSGTGYSEISASLALGETPSTAYRGDRGKIAYDHSQVTHDKNLVGLGNVDNTSDLNKPISTATQNALNTKANIVDIPSKTSFTQDILVSNWTLVGGKYEAVISNSGILANSFVDVIPSNDNVDIVRAAQIYPSVLISEGSVKVYSKFLPSGTISVTVNVN